MDRIEEWEREMEVRLWVLVGWSFVLGFVVGLVLTPWVLR